MKAFLETEEKVQCHVCEETHRAWGLYDFAQGSVLAVAWQCDSDPKKLGFAPVGDPGLKRDQVEIMQQFIRDVVEGDRADGG